MIHCRSEMLHFAFKYYVAMKILHSPSKYHISPWKSCISVQKYYISPSNDPLPIGNAGFSIQMLCSHENTTFSLKIPHFPQKDVDFCSKIQYSPQNASLPFSYATEPPINAMYSPSKEQYFRFKCYISIQKSYSSLQEAIFPLRNTLSVIKRLHCRSKMLHFLLEKLHFSKCSRNITFFSKKNNIPV